MVINSGEQMQKGQFKRRGGKKKIKQRERERDGDKIASESKEGLFRVSARK